MQWHRPGDLDPIEIPRFAVPSLIDNAIKHNRERVDPLHIDVHLSRSPDAFRIVVDDDGRGFDPARDAAGRSLEPYDGSPAAAGARRCAARRPGSAPPLGLPME